MQFINHQPMVKVTKPPSKNRKRSSLSEGKNIKIYTVQGPVVSVSNIIQDHIKSDQSNLVHAAKFFNHQTGTYDNMGSKDMKGPNLSDPPKLNTSTEEQMFS